MERKNAWAAYAEDDSRVEAFAKAYWDMITEFTGGDMSMLANLVRLGQFEGMDPKWKEKQALANAYIGRALDAYFTKLGVDPFRRETE